MLRRDAGVQRRRRPARARYTPTSPRTTERPRTYTPTSPRTTERRPRPRPQRQPSYRPPARRYLQAGGLRAPRPYSPTSPRTTERPSSAQNRAARARIRRRQQQQVAALLPLVGRRLAPRRVTPPQLPPSVRATENRRSLANVAPAVRAISRGAYVGLPRGFARGNTVDALVRAYVRHPGARLLAPSAVGNSARSSELPSLASPRMAGIRVPRSMYAPPTRSAHPARDLGDLFSNVGRIPGQVGHNVAASLRTIAGGAQVPLLLTQRLTEPVARAVERATSGGRGSLATSLIPSAPLAAARAVNAGPFLGNVVRDASSIPAQTVLGLAQIISDTASKGPVYAAKRNVVAPYEQLVDDPAGFISKHPVTAALMVKGALHAPGRAAGSAARGLGSVGVRSAERVASTRRPFIEAGPSMVRERHYSANPFNKLVFERPFDRRFTRPTEQRGVVRLRDPFTESRRPRPQAWGGKGPLRHRLEQRAGRAWMAHERRVRANERAELTELERRDSRLRALKDVQKAAGGRRGRRGNTAEANLVLLMNEGRVRPGHIASDLNSELARLQEIRRGIPASAERDRLDVAIGHVRAGIDKLRAGKLDQGYMERTARNLAAVGRSTRKESVDLAVLDDTQAQRRVLTPAIQAGDARAAAVRGAGPRLIYDPGGAPTEGALAYRAAARNVTAAAREVRARNRSVTRAAGVDRRGERVAAKAVEGAEREAASARRAADAAEGRAGTNAERLAARARARQASASAQALRTVLRLTKKASASRAVAERAADEGRMAAQVKASRRTLRAHADAMMAAQRARSQAERAEGVAARRYKRTGRVEDGQALAAARWNRRRAVEAHRLARKQFAALRSPDEVAGARAIEARKRAVKADRAVARAERAAPHAGPESVGRLVTQLDLERRAAGARARVASAEEGVRAARARYRAAKGSREAQLEAQVALREAERALAQRRQDASELRGLRYKTTSPRWREPGAGERGRAPSVERMRELAREGGVDPDILGYVSHEPGTAGRGYYVPAKSRRTLAKQSYKGKSFEKAGYDTSWQATLDTAARQAGVRSVARSWDAMIREAGLGRSRDGQAAVAGGRRMTMEEAKALAAKWNDEHPQDQRVPVPAFARSHYEAMQRILDGTDPWPDKRIENVAELLSDELRRAVQSAEESGRNFVLVPRSYFDTYMQHLDHNYIFGPNERLIASSFRRTVLTLSPRWLAGNVVEGVLRSLVGGAGAPHHYRTAGRMLAALGRHDEALAVQMRHSAMGGMLYGTGARMGARTPLGLRLEEATSHGPARALKAVHDGALGISDAIFSLNRAVETNAFQRAAFGRWSHRELQEFSGSWLRAVRAQQGLFDEMVRDWSRDPRILDAKISAAGRYVDRALGKYSKFPAGVRRAIQAYAPFIPWYINAWRFFLWTMPAKHPVQTAVITATIHALDKDLKEKLLKAPPGDLRYALPVGEGKAFNAARFTPAGAFTSPVAESLWSQIIPAFSGAARTGAGFIPSKWGVEAKDENGKPITDSLVLTALGLNSLAESLVPGLSQARRILEGPGKSAGNSWIGQPRTVKGKPSSIWDKLGNPLAVATYGGKKKRKRKSSGGGGGGGVLTLDGGGSSGGGGSGGGGGVMVLP